MRRIEKHNFEAVSLLTVDNGQFDITIIPAIGQPDWVIPSSLILAVDEYHDYIWTYLWNNQEVAVYHLIPRQETPDKIVVLEGNTEVHRVGLLTKGSLQKKRVRISDVKDVAMPTDFAAVDSDTQKGFSTASTTSPATNTASLAANPAVNDSVTQPANDFNNEPMLAYAYQAVEIEGKLYFVPDLDTLAHHLVDLDSE